MNGYSCSRPNSRLTAGGCRLEAGGWRLGAGGCRLEAGGWRLEAGGWGLEAGGWRLGAGGWRLEAVGWRLEAGGWGPLPFDFGGGFWGRLLGAAFGGGFWGRPAACLLPPAFRLLAIILLAAGCWLSFCWLLAAGYHSAGLLAGHRLARWASFPSDRPQPLRSAALRCAGW